METIEVSSALLVINLKNVTSGSFWRAQAHKVATEWQFMDALAGRAGQHRFGWWGKAGWKVAPYGVLSRLVETPARPRYIMQRCPSRARG